MKNNYTTTFASPLPQALKNTYQVMLTLLRSAAEVRALFVSVLSLVIRLSAGSDGILSIVTELLELVVVMLSVLTAIFSSGGTFLVASLSGKLLSLSAFVLLAILALHFFQRLRYLVYQLTDCALMLETAEAMAATTNSHHHYFHPAHTWQDSVYS